MDLKSLEYSQVTALEQRYFSLLNRSEQLNREGLLCVTFSLTLSITYVMVSISPLPSLSRSSFLRDHHILAELHRGNWEKAVQPAVLRGGGRMLGIPPAQQPPAEDDALCTSPFQHAIF